MMMSADSKNPLERASAADMVTTVVERRTGHPGRVSFDVNLRPVLWPDMPTAARTLLDLSRAADLIFIGDDEAEALFGTSELGALAELIRQRDDQELVLKQGAHGATLASRNGEFFESALSADVLDPTGAGDAFAAGYLAASSFGWPESARLRLGHLLGSRVVGVLADVPPPLTPEEMDDLSPSFLAERWSQDQGH